MKTFGKLIICIIVILVAISIAYLVYNGEDRETNNNALTNTNAATNVSNTNNDTNKNNKANEIDENKDYIGEEENKEDETIQEDTTEQLEKEPDREQEQEEQPEELTGKDKAIDIIKKQYAMEGQAVGFDHMEGNNYIIKINAGTAETWWYLVDGTTWEAQEY